MRHFLVEEIASMIRSQLKPKLILFCCIDVLLREKVEVPSYFRLSELILSATNSRKRDLATVIERTLGDFRANPVPESCSPQSSASRTKTEPLIGQHRSNS
jgi:hypothetical protein